MTESLFDVALGKALLAYGLMICIAIGAAFFVRGVVFVLAAGQKQKVKPAGPTPVVVSVTPARNENAEIAAAIAAAVFAVLGAHRLVYIGEAKPTFGWTGEIRSRLHTSHAPRHDHH